MVFALPSLDDYWLNFKLCLKSYNIFLQLVWYNFIQVILSKLDYVQNIYYRRTNYKKY